MNGATSMDDVKAAASRQMKLAVFASAGPVSGSHGGWRHPEASGDLLSAAYHQDLGRYWKRAASTWFFSPTFWRYRIGCVIVSTANCAMEPLVRCAWTRWWSWD